MRLLLFLLFPILELYLLVKVGGAFGAGRVVLWVLVSALLGIWALRSQGQGAFTKMQADFAAGRMPQTPLDGILLFIGGVLLILPGFITDFFGILLLLPPIRRVTAFVLGTYIVTLVAKRMAAPGSGSNFFVFRSGGFTGKDFSGAGNQHFQGPEHLENERFTAEADAFSSGKADEMYGADIQKPRQAVIIEASAIDIQASRTEEGTGNTSDPGASDSVDRADPMSAAGTSGNTGADPSKP